MHFLLWRVVTPSANGIQHPVIGHIHLERRHADVVVRCGPKIGALSAVAGITGGTEPINCLASRVNLLDHGLSCVTTAKACHASNQASSVLDVLRLALAEHNVNVICEEAPAHIEKTSKGSFRIRTAAHSYTADALILATGGRAAPKTGSDGSGYVLAKAFGHRIIRPLPALVQLKCAEPYFKQLAGIRTEANVELLADNSPVASDHIHQSGNRSQGQ